jgi:hypothetical protein
VPTVYRPLVLGLRQAQRGRPVPLDVVEAVGDPGLAVDDVGERQVGCVPALAVGGEVLGSGLYSIQEDIH